MAQKVATAYKIKPRQMTTLMGKLNSDKDKQFPFNLITDSDMKSDKTVTRDIFKFRQATREPLWQGLR